VLIRKGFHVFGTVRKMEDADRLRAKRGEAFTPLHFEVTDEQLFCGQQRLRMIFSKAKHCLV
jgi:hypothetical protein